MLNPQDIRALSKIQQLKVLASVGGDWLCILICFATAIYFVYWPVSLIAFLVIARMQLGLAIMMHDGAHKRLSNSLAWNEFISQFVCAGPLFFSAYSYRSLHLKHHQNPLAADDPDITLIGGYPISKKSFLRKLLRDASGVTYFKFIKYFLHMMGKTKARKATSNQGEKREKPPFFLIISSILFSNILIFSCFYFLGHPWFYLILWILPSWTALQVLLRIRGIAEHAGFKENSDQRKNARTVAPSWQTLIFAPHNVNYHVEHHCYPSVPCGRLPELHRLMLEQKGHSEENIYPGYGSVLRELVR